MQGKVQASDGEACELALQLLAHAQGTVLESALRAVSQALEQFDFDEADGLIAQAIEHLPTADLAALAAERG